MTFPKQWLWLAGLGVLVVIAVIVALSDFGSGEKTSSKKEESKKAADDTIVAPTNHLLPEVTDTGTEIRIVAPVLYENDGHQTNGTIDTAVLQETVKNAVANLKPGNGPVKVTVIAPVLSNVGTGSPSQVVVVDMSGFRPLVDHGARYSLERPFLRTNDLSWSHQVIWADLSDKVIR